MRPASKGAFDRDGYVVAHAMFPPAEVDALRDHFMSLRKRGSYAHDLVGVEPSGHDPLRRYPRMAQMHRWDITSLRWLLDPRLGDCLTTWLGVEPYAVQTMLYFKPPGVPRPDSCRVRLRHRDGVGPCHSTMCCDTVSQGPLCSEALEVGLALPSVPLIAGYWPPQLKLSRAGGSDPERLAGRQRRSSCRRPRS